MDLCMNLGHFQPPIWHTLDLKTTQIYGCWCCMLEYKHSNLWLLWIVVGVVTWCFCPTSAHPLFIFGQAVCLDLLKDERLLSVASATKVLNTQVDRVKSPWEDWRNPLKSRHVDDIFFLSCRPSSPIVSKNIELRQFQLIFCPTCYLPTVI
jgi:hypothetical protein